jgi:hypothetical protein
MGSDIAAVHIIDFGSTYDVHITSNYRNRIQHDDGILCQTSTIILLQVKSTYR